MSVRWKINKDGKTKTAFIDITIAGCQRLRESTGIKSDQKNAKQRAREYHDKRQHDLWRQARLGDKPRRTWEEAVVKWISEHQHKKSLTIDCSRLRWLSPHLRGHYLDQIDRELTDEILQEKQNEGVSMGTVNRHAALLRSILRAACLEWNWIETVPKIRMRKEADEKVVWMTREETDMLLHELEQASRVVYEAVIFTLNTGLRASNVSQLKWEQINLEKRSMYIYKTKNGQALGTPLNSDVLEVLRRNLGNRSIYVFTHRGHPMSRFNNTAWNNALKRTLARIQQQHHGQLPDRLTGFNWHSLRHTWASWMAQAGCPMEQLQKLGGWKNATMVLRYAHFSTDQLAQFSELTARKKPALKLVA